MSPGPMRDSVARRAAHAHVDQRRRLSHHLDAIRELLEFERHAKPALHRLVAGNEQPQQDGKADRQRLQPEMAERPRCLHAVCTSRRRLVGLLMTSDRSRARSTSVERPRSICPSTTSEMLPVSSDTTMAIESFSSVSPIAARCREPEFLAQLRIHRERKEAGRGRDPILLDDDGTVVQRRLDLEDADDQVVGQHRIERDAALDVVAQANLAFEGNDGAHPLRREHARRDSQFLDRFLGAIRPLPGSGRTGARPKCASARRMSDWNSTMKPKTKYPNRLRTSQFTVSRCQPPRPIEQQGQQAAADRHLNGTGAANQLQDLVDQDRHHEDVGEVPPADRRSPEQRVDPGPVHDVL